MSILHLYVLPRWSCTNFRQASGVSEAYYMIMLLSYNDASVGIPATTQLARRLLACPYPICIRHYGGIVAFSQTDFADDFKKVTVPVRVMPGAHDQVVPYENSGAMSAKLLKNGSLKPYFGFANIYGGQGIAPRIPISVLPKR